MLPEMRPRSLDSLALLLSLLSLSPFPLSPVGDKLPPKQEVRTPSCMNEKKGGKGGLVSVGSFIGPCTQAGSLDSFSYKKKCGWSRAVGRRDFDSLCGCYCVVVVHKYETKGNGGGFRKVAKGKNKIKHCIVGFIFLCFIFSIVEIEFKMESFPCSFIESLIRPFVR
jgi:hypothetical protein